MPKKKVEFAEDRDEPEVEEVWDVRKIIVGIVVLILLIFGGIVGKRLLLHESLAPSSFIPPLPSVKGLSTFNSPDNGNSSPVHISIPSSDTIQQQVKTIQQEVTHLNVNDIASSSPQVQEVLKQLQQLPSGPVGQVKDACMRLCSQL